MATAQPLRAVGLQPRVERVLWPDYADTPHGTKGWRVRVGSYATQTAGQSASQPIIAAGFRTAVDWTGYDADQPANRENPHVAIINPRTFTGTLEGTHDGNLAQRETTSSVAAKQSSLVATNGGFFITSNADGVQGTQVLRSAVERRMSSDGSERPSVWSLNWPPLPCRGRRYAAR